MKKLILLPILFITFFASCSSDDGGTPPPPSNLFVVEGTICTLTENADATVTIVMKSAKFANAMPPMDITLPNLPVYKNGDAVSILAGSVIPEAMFGGVVGPLEQYTISNLSGNITANGLSFQGFMERGKIAFEGVPDAAGYKGTTTVTTPGGEASTDVPVVDVKEFPATVSSVDAGEDNALTITLSNVSFAQGMPPMDIRIPAIPFVEESRYECATVVPLVSMNGSPFMPMERYTMSDVQSVFSGDDLQLSLSFSMGYLRYIAKLADSGYTGVMTFTKIIEE